MCYEIWLKILLELSIDLNHSYNLWKTSVALEIYIKQFRETLGTFMQKIYSQEMLKLVLVLLKFMKFRSNNAFIVSLAML